MKSQQLQKLFGISTKAVVFTLMAGSLFVSASLAAQGIDEVADSIVVQETGTAVTFAGGTVKSGGILKVRVSGPNGSAVFEDISKSGLVDWAVKSDLPDGVYFYDAWFTPSSPEAAAGETVDGRPASSQSKTEAPTNSTYRSGSFKIEGGFIQPNYDEELTDDLSVSSIGPEPNFGEKLVGTILNWFVAPAQAGTCATPCEVGTGESQVTLIPSTGSNWEIETASDGSQYRIGPSGGSTEPFKMVAGAPENSFFMNSAGFLGVGTSTPLGELHILGDSTNASLILEETDGPRWEILTAGDQLQFDRESTPANDDAMTLDTSGNLTIDGDMSIGGEHTAATSLHIQTDEAGLRVQDGAGTGPRTMFQLVNPGGKVRFLMNAAGDSWTFDADDVGNSFNITNTAATGNLFRLFDNGDLRIQGTAYAVNHVNTSSRAVKTDFSPIDETTMLEKVAALDISQWRYKKDPESSVHVGPMAEEFQAVFGLGDGRHISTVDTAGVALAAIKGLKNENDAKQERIDELEARIARLEKLISEK